MTEQIISQERRPQMITGESMIDGRIDTSISLVMTR